MGTNRRRTLAPGPRNGYSRARRSLGGGADRMSLERQSQEPIPERIDIGRILSGSLTVLRTRLGDLLIVAVLFLLVPQVLLGFAPAQFPDPEFAFWNLLAAIPGLVFDGAASLIAYGALTGAAGPTAGDAVRAGVLKLSQLFVVLLGGGLAILVGLILLVAPGLFLAASLLVATPVLMIENTTVLEAFKRSVSLSRGSRWRLLGVMLVLAAISLGAAALTASALQVTILATTDEIGKRLALFVFGPILALVIRLVVMAVVTSAYVELKRVNGSASAVAKTFD